MPREMFLEGREGFVAFALAPGREDYGQSVLGVR